MNNKTDREVTQHAIALHGKGIYATFYKHKDSKDNASTLRVEYKKGREESLFKVLVYWSLFFDTINIDIQNTMETGGGCPTCEYTYINGYEIVIKDGDKPPDGMKELLKKL